MRCPRIWVIWLSLAASAFWAGTGITRAQEASLQRRTTSRIPLERIQENLRDYVRNVIEQPTLFGHGPTEVFAGQPALYDWVLDHPDRVVLAWRRLGAKCTEIAERGDHWFSWTDGLGSEIHWQTVYQEPKMRIWYAEGTVRPGLFMPAVPIRAVLFLRYGDRTQSTGRTVIYHQADVFLHLDGKTAAILTRMLGPSAPRLAEQCLAQMETFFSGIVWYLEQHPERSETLLAEKKHERSTSGSPPSLPRNPPVLTETLRN
jgi:hypothetical protein